MRDRMLRARRALALAIDLLVALPIALAMERVYKLYLVRASSRVFSSAPDSRALLVCMAIAFVLYRTLAEADGAGLGRSILGLEIDRGPSTPGLWRSFVRALVPWRGIDRLLGLRVIHS